MEIERALSKMVKGNRRSLDETNKNFRPEKKVAILRKCLVGKEDVVKVRSEYGIKTTVYPDGRRSSLRMGEECSKAEKIEV